MPPPLHWSPTADSHIHRMRGSGATWDAIAAALRVSRWSAIARGRRIGALAPECQSTEAGAADLAREPLAAGSPVSWAVLTEGTLLADQPYPWPPLPFAGSEPVSGKTWNIS